MLENHSIDVKQLGWDDLRILHKDTLKRHRTILRRQKTGGILFSIMFLSSLFSIPYGVLFVPEFGFWGGVVLTMFSLVCFGFLALIGKVREEYMRLARPFLGYGLEPELQDEDVLRFRKEVLFRLPGINS